MQKEKRKAKYYTETGENYKIVNESDQKRCGKVCENFLEKSRLITEIIRKKRKEKVF